jgi:hypothetical protein
MRRMIRVALIRVKVVSHYSRKRPPILPDGGVQAYDTQLP